MGVRPTPPLMGTEDEADLTVPADVRSQLASAIRERRRELTSDLAAIFAAEFPVDLTPQAWQRAAELILDLVVTAIQNGELDPRTGALGDLDRVASGVLSTTHLFAVVYFGERTLLDELALHEQLGATTDPWPMVAQFVRRASFDVLSAFAERLAATPAHGVVRDPLTTLIVRPVFDLALAQEVHRAQRHQHPLSLILFDVDNLATINEEFGYGVGDRVLERMGILVRRFFRTHDWVARHAEDSIAALLPQTTLDDAADLADRVRSMVEQRLTFKDDRANRRVAVTLSAAAVGSDVIESELDPYQVIAEAEDAVRRAKLSGRNRAERVALLPTSVSLLGAANLLDIAPYAVRRLVRAGQLSAERRGRHYHIDRASVEKYRVDLLARLRGG